MKKLFLASITLLLFLVSVSPQSVLATTTSASPTVIAVDGNSFLLDDGTIWLKRTWATTGYEKINIGAKTLSNGVALTSKNELIIWERNELPSVDKTQTNIKQLTNYYYLKDDGTVWDYSGTKVNGLSDIKLIDSNARSLASLNSKGELYVSTMQKKITKIEDPASIASLKMHGGEDLAYLTNSGQVVVISLYDFEFIDGDPIYNTHVLTEDAVHIEYENYTGSLIVTKKDGTVWKTKTKDFNDKFKLTEKYTAIKNAATVEPYYGDLVKDNASRYEQLLVKHTDGTLKIYINNEAFSIVAPTVSSMNFTASNEKPVVGNTITFKLVLLYSNGYKEIFDSKDFNVAFNKTHLLKAVGDGSYKTVGVGETKATASMNGLSKTLTLSTSHGNNLTGAVNKENVTYLPLVSVFKALGGTVNTVPHKEGTTFDIQVGNTTLQLKAGSKKVMINGKENTLNQVVHVHNGTTVFPAALLTKASLANLEWDKKYKQMKITIGKAKLIVESTDTPKLQKAEQQGNLTNFINKSYWVNSYSNWERFIKVTVTDVLPVGGDNFQIIFKTTNGGTLKSDITSRDFVSLILNDSYTFLSFDPYKKYNWSSSTWDLIKASKIKTGMNKTQVDLSWGHPSSTSKISSDNITIEVWRYGTQYVSFTNGIVQSIYTY